MQLYVNITFFSVTFPNFLAWVSTDVLLTLPPATILFLSSILTPFSHDVPSAGDCMLLNLVNLNFSSQYEKQARILRGLKISF